MSRSLEVKGDNNVVQIFWALWDEKSLVLLGGALGLILSLLVSISMPDIYQARALLAPRSDASGSSISGLVSQYSGLASLAGINLGGVGGEGLSRSKIAQERLKSLVLFEENLYDQLVLDLMATEDWDPYANSLIYDPKIFDSARNVWVREVSHPRSPKPSIQEAHEAFLERLSISEDSKSGLISIALEHHSPHVAQSWLNLLIERVSEDSRSRDIREAEDSIAFLQMQREQTDLVSLDGIFAQLIEEQTKTIMLANVYKNYVFEIIDPPIAPELKLRPQRVLICLLSTIIGLFLGASVAVLRIFVSERAGPDPSVI